MDSTGELECIPMRSASVGELSVPGSHCCRRHTRELLGAHVAKSKKSCRYENSNVPPCFVRGWLVTTSQLSMQQAKQRASSQCCCIASMSNSFTPLPTINSCYLEKIWESCSLYCTFPAPVVSAGSSSVGYHVLVDISSTLPKNAPQ